MSAPKFETVPEPVPVTLDQVPLSAALPAGMSSRTSRISAWSRYLGNRRSSDLLTGAEESEIYADFEETDAAAQPGAGSSARSASMRTVDDSSGRGSEQGRRKEDRRWTLERDEARNRAGQNTEDVLRRANEAELALLEKAAWSPEAKSWNVDKKNRLFNRYEELLAEVRPDYPGRSDASRRRLIKDENNRRAALHEQLYTPRETATPPQTNWISGHVELPGQALQWTDPHARPDYTVYRMNGEGVLERVHVNLKAHKLHEKSAAEARSVARNEIAPQAVRNAAHLPTGDAIVISFVRMPSDEVKAAILEQLFFEGSPIREVRFGGAAFKSNEYFGPRAPTAEVKLPKKRPPANALIANAIHSPGDAQQLQDRYRDMSIERLSALAGIDKGTWEEVPGAKVDWSARRAWDEYASLTGSELRERQSRGDKLADKFLQFHESFRDKDQQVPRAAAQVPTGNQSPSTRPAEGVNKVIVNEPLKTMAPATPQAAPSSPQAQPDAPVKAATPQVSRQLRPNRNVIVEEQKLGQAKAAGAVEIAILLAKGAETTRLHQDVRRSSALRTWAWWYEKGVLPSASVVVDRWLDPDEPTAVLPQALLSMEQFDGLEVDGLIHPAQFAQFAAWARASLHTFDDYIKYFVEVLDPGVRRNGSTWEVQVWRWDDDLPAASFSEWEPDARVTELMEPIYQQLKDQTARDIGDTAQQRKSPPMGRVVGSRWMRHDFGISKALYSPTQPEVAMVLNALFDTGFEPVFLLLEGADTPAGKSLVIGGDLRTHVLLREQRIWISENRPTISTSAGRSGELRPNKQAIALVETDALTDADPRSRE